MIGYEQKGGERKGERRDFPSGPVAKTQLPMQGARGSITVWGTRSHILQLKKNSHAATKTRPNQIHKFFFFKTVIFKKEKMKITLA